jgi:hypothetical protein
MPRAVGGGWWVLLDEASNDWRVVRASLAGDVLRVVDGSTAGTAWAVPLA